MTGPTVEPTWAAIVDGEVRALADGLVEIRRRKIRGAAYTLVDAGISVGDRWPRARGAGRPKIGERVELRLDTETMTRARGIAERDGAALADVLRRAVIAGLR